MAYVRNIQEVTEVKETERLGEVNDLIRDGWMLLGVVTPNHSTPEKIKFSLGKLPIHVDAPN